MLQISKNNLLLPIEDRETASRSPGSYGYVLLQDGQRWLTFSDPIRIVAAHEVGEVRPALDEIDHAITQQGFYAAGFISYEASAAFDLAVHQAELGGMPLLWFGLYNKPAERFSRFPPGIVSEKYRFGKWQASLEKNAYTEAIKAIKNYIAGADTYQVNFTMHLQSQFSGDPWTLFCDLVQTQQADYAAYLNLGQHVVCSASPELFFKLEGNDLTSRPMKGTTVRGRTTSEDRQQIAELGASIKNRAENVMIVDMIRNDFGRVAEIGTVKVPYLFTIEKYPTLLQMTSTVTAQSTAGLPEIMEAMFPCASITGAPKVRTMQIIKSLESKPRGIYTGAIGFIAPERQAQFNVAIRTVVIDRDTGVADYGVGSGIVWDSDVEAEYEECRVKAQVLTRRWPSFDLLESLLWTPGEGYFLLDKHLQRLADSAEYFAISFDEQEIIRHLRTLAHTLPGPHKVRLLLQIDGNIKSQAISLGKDGSFKPVNVGLANNAVDSNNIWLYHKTTYRQLYKNARASRPDCEEVILWNERGELSEAATANIVLDLNGQLVTPPISSGLLAGTFRQHLLEVGQIRERILTISDLQRCKQLYLINSVRRWRSAKLIFFDTKEG